MYQFLLIVAFDVGAQVVVALSLSVGTTIEHPLNANVIPPLLE